MNKDKRNLWQNRLVSDMARVARVEYGVAVACVGDYHGRGCDMVDILRFVAERRGKATANQVAMLSSYDWRVQRKGCMEVLGKELWAKVQHSCGSNSQRVETLARFLVVKD